MSGAASQAARGAESYPGLLGFAPELARRLTGLETLSGWDDAIPKAAEASPPVGLLRLLAASLTGERLMRWTCLAVRLEEVLSRRAPSPALVAAEKLLRETDPALGPEAERLAEAEGFETPAALAALAVVAFRAGGDLRPATRATANGVLTMVAAGEVLGAAGFELLNRIGLDLARGGDGRAGAHDAMSAAAR